VRDAARKNSKVNGEFATENANTARWNMGRGPFRSCSARERFAGLQFEKCIRQMHPAPTKLNRFSPKSTSNLLVDCWWVWFLTTAGGAGSNYIGSQPQQLAWFVADLIVIFAFSLAPKTYIGYAMEIPVLMSWPALATLSSIWSLTPALSAYHGLQFVATYLVGLYFLNRYGLFKIAKMIFVSFAIAGVCSIIAIGMNHPYSRDAINAWSGVYTTKNELGIVMSFELILGLLFLWAGWQRTMVTGVMVLALVLLVNSRSANSIVVLSVILPTIFPLAFCLKLGTRVTGTFIGFALAGVCLIGAILIIFQIDPYHNLLETFDKDTTLTGRTTLWTFGLESFWEHPILGIGYKAYWESSVTTSAYLASIIKQELKSFHNNLLDVAVALGTIGAIAFIWGLISVFIATFRAYLRAPSALSLWPLAFTMYVILLGLNEYPLFYNHGLYQLFIVAIAVGVQRNMWEQPASDTQPPIRSSLQVATGVAHVDLR
jgi:exopolysaccharide production protein ExoQ